MAQELKPIKQGSAELGEYWVYDAEEVDAVLAEKDKEITELKAKLESVQASMDADLIDAGMENRKLKRALWLIRADRYKMLEFIAREEANLRNQIPWSRYLRKRTYDQWVDQLLRIANLASKLYSKCRAKAEEYR